MILTTFIYGFTFGTKIETIVMGCLPIVSSIDRKKTTISPGEINAAGRILSEKWFFY